MQPFSVFDVFDTMFSVIPGLDKKIDGAKQGVINVSDRMVPAIPSPDRFTSNIVQDPAFTCFHARLMNAVAEHVIVVAHDDATLLVAVLDHSVAHGTLVAFNVEFDASGIRLLDNGIILL